MMLFGQRTKLYGEMYEDGVASVVHPEAQDPATALSRRLKIRLACKQVLERHHARDLLRRSVAARTRPVKEVEIGQRVMFYRHYSTSVAVKKQSARGSFMGPGIILGRQNKNVWVSYAGRCYLVCLEHIRALSPDDHAALRPVVLANLQELKKASVTQDYVDLCQQISSRLLNWPRQMVLEKPS